jgi:hypothetical protein
MTYSKSDVSTLKDEGTDEKTPEEAGPASPENTDVSGDADVDADEEV